MSIVNFTARLPKPLLTPEMRGLVLEHGTKERSTAGTTTDPVTKCAPSRRRGRKTLVNNG